MNLIFAESSEIRESEKLKKLLKKAWLSYSILRMKRFSHFRQQSNILSKKKHIMKTKTIDCMKRNIIPEGMLQGLKLMACIHLWNFHIQNHGKFHLYSIRINHITKSDVDPDRNPGPVKMCDR